MSDKCRKCHGGDIHFSWHRDKWDCSFESRHYRKVAPDEEHIHYHCRRCGFEWTGPPKDTAHRTLAETEADDGAEVRP